MKAKKSKSSRSKGCKTSDDEAENQFVRIQFFNQFSEFAPEFTLVPSSFAFIYEEQYDYAVLKFKKTGFTMSRVPVALTGINYTMKIHAFGYVGHNGQFTVANGEVSVVDAATFSMNIQSAPRYSGAALIADGIGRVVGNMFGNVDSSRQKNPQHLSMAYKIDRVVEKTHRQYTPHNSPDKALENPLTISSSSKNETKSVKKVLKRKRND